MSTLQEASDCWDTVENRLSGWLNERQELIEIFCILTDVTEKKSHPKILSKTVQRFCVILMDYISAGHFEIYEELVTEAKVFNDRNVSLVDHIYPDIDTTTELALVFNDTYEANLQKEIPFKNLNEDLQNLGQALELRFALEDFLIEKLHSNHKMKVA